MKKNLTFSKLLMLIAIAVLPLSMMAQKEVGNKNLRPAEKYWYIQLDGGLSINHGDLANYNGGIWDDFNHFKSVAMEPTWNGHLGIGYQFGKVIGLNFKGGYGLLSGHKHQQALVLNNNADRTLWNLGLDQTNYIEGNLNLTFNLFNMFNYNPRRVINLVPHIGFGGIYYQAGVVNQLNNDDEVASTLADKAAERELNFTVPAGMEITFNVAPKFDIFVDYTYNFTGTDNLDQVAKIQADEEYRVINDKDMYSQLNLGLRYKFNNPCNIEEMAKKKLDVRVNPDPLVEGEDGNVCFDVIVTVPTEFFQKEAVLNLKPYLTYNGGQIELPEPIIMVGEKVKADNGYDFRVPYKEGGEFTKHYCIPYQEEMENSELMGDPMYYVYDGNIYPTQDEIVKNAYFASSNTLKLADGVVPLPCPEVKSSDINKSVNDKTITWTWAKKDRAESYDVVVMKDNQTVAQQNVTEPRFTYTAKDGGDYTIEVLTVCSLGKAPKPGNNTANVKVDEVLPDFIYYFDYNKSNILGNSRAVINKNKGTRVTAKEKVKGEIKSIRIEGWASPEGENAGINQPLSEDRANSAMKDIKDVCKAKGIEFICNGNGPDFERFYKLVNESTLPQADKDAIINKVKRAGSDRQKEIEVKELSKSYNELEAIFKEIRRAEVYINY